MYKNLMTSDRQKYIFHNNTIIFMHHIWFPNIYRWRSQHLGETVEETYIFITLIYTTEFT